MRQLLISILLATCAFVVAVDKAFDKFSSGGVEVPHVELIDLVRP